MADDLLPTKRLFTLVIVCPIVVIGTGCLAAEKFEHPAEMRNSAEFWFFKIIKENNLFKITCNS